jgi:hypothetical protein
MDDFAAPPPPAASRAAADAFARERELDAPAESIAPATPPPAPLPPAPAPPRQRPPGPRSWGADTNATVVPAPPVPGSSDDWFAASGSVAPAPPGFGNMSARGAQPPPPQAQPQPPAVEETVRRRNIRGTGAMASAYATPAQAERPDCVGQVGNIAVAELVRFMFLGKKSGIVDVSHEEFRGEIAFSQGEIVKAATTIEDREVNRSLVALKTMCGWRQGRFKIVFCDVAANPNAVKTTAAFLAEQFGTAPLERG